MSDYSLASQGPWLHPQDTILWVAEHTADLQSSILPQPLVDTLQK